MRTKDEKLHHRRKAEILDAATACFSEKGIRQTTMQEICKRAKLSPGALYRYYSSKDDIIIAMAALEKTSNDQLISYLKSQKNVLKALRQALPDIVKEISDPSLASLTLEIATEAARNPVVAKPFLENEEKFKTELVALLLSGQESGFVEKSIDISAFIHLFMHLLDGICTSHAFPSPLSQKASTKSLDHMIYRALSPISQLQ
ncbi:MAG: TetR/AcrR family transcriptional regulator [Sneathiella sp.]